VQSTRNLSIVAAIEQRNAVCELNLLPAAQLVAPLASPSHERSMDNFAQIRHQAQMADNHTADLEIKRLAQAVISLSRLCEEALKLATQTYEQSQKAASKRLRA
jgi:hypothetical protein